MRLIQRENETFKYDLLKIIKNNDTNYKAIQFKHRVKESGFEKIGSKSKLPKEEKQQIKTCPMTEEYLAQSISRTKKTIFEYALCNDFDYFVTLTFDRKRYNSCDLKTLKKQVGQWLNNYKKRINPNLKYLIIPELHKDNKHFHFHGLISGIEDVTEFRESIRGTMRYNWTAWHNKFGFTSLEKVQNREAISKYITKYITKDVLQVFNQHRYLCSKGLQKPETLFEVTHYGIEMPCDFENDFVRVKTYNSYDEMYNALLKEVEYIKENGGASMWK